MERIRYLFLISVGLIVFVFLAYCVRYHKIAQLFEFVDHYAADRTQLSGSLLFLDWESSEETEDRKSEKRAHLISCAAARIGLDDKEGAEVDIARARKLQGTLAPVDYMFLIDASKKRLRDDWTDDYYRRFLEDNPRFDKGYSQWSTFLRSANPKLVSNPKQRAVEMAQKAIEVYGTSPLGRAWDEANSQRLRQWNLYQKLAEAQKAARLYNDARESATRAKEFLIVDYVVKKKEDQRTKRNLLLELDDLIEDCTQ